MTRSSFTRSRRQFQPRLLASPPPPDSGSITLPPNTLELAHVSGMQTVTPPPSPKLLPPSSSCRPRHRAYQYWGYLEPLGTPYRNWYFSRTKTSYRIGSGNTMDLQVTTAGSIIFHHTTISWNKTDDDGAVQVVGYSGHHGEPYGTYINDQRIPDNTPTTLCHGDRLTFGTIGVMSADEDLRFVWLQCTHNGWLDHYYQQDSGHFGMNLDELNNFYDFPGAYTGAYQRNDNPQEDPDEYHPKKYPVGYRAKTPECLDDYHFDDTDESTPSDPLAFAGW
ncbi:hypothetical protein BKA93DRAFT_313667 [Sparassis latifolia]